MMIKYKKEVLVILLVLALLLIAGCQRGPRQIDIYRGTEGVKVSFPDNLPPRELYEGSVVLVSVELWNKGAHPLDDWNNNHGIATLNYDPLYFSPETGPGLVDPASFLGQGHINRKFLVQGRSYDFHTGEKYYADLGFLRVKEVPGTREAPLTNIQAGVCYPYRTVLSQSVCIDADIYGLEHDPVCRSARTHSYSGGQGAPVVISRVESSMIPLGFDTSPPSGSAPLLDEEGALIGLRDSDVEGQMVLIQPSFRIYFRNADRGIVYTHREGVSIENACNPAIEGRTREDLNTLKVEASLGNITLECQPEVVRLLNNEGSTRCVLPLDGISGMSRNYMDILNIEAKYLYSTHVSKQVRINRAS